MPTGNHDDVDHYLAQWTRERPDLDSSPMALVGRLARASAECDARLQHTFAKAGLSAGDADVLFALRRAGHPFQLSPRQIGESTLVTSGAVTKRVDRLAKVGLVTRTISADDGRAREIKLTDAGVELADRMIADHWANEAELVSGLTTHEREELTNLLRKLLISLCN